MGGVKHTAANKPTLPAPDHLTERIAADKPGKAGACATVPACSITGDWPPGRAAASQMSWVKAQRARENSAYVRKLLGQRQPGFAAALAFAEQYFSCLSAGRGDGGGTMIRHRTYHLDGTTCYEAPSCSGRGHTRIPPHCDAEPTAEIAGRAVTCDLPKSHPGPHLDVETGWRY